MRTKSSYLILSAGVLVALLLWSGGRAGNSFTAPAAAMNVQGNSTKNAQAAGTQAPGADDGKKITICHVPPGNTGNPQTITIAAAAWKTNGKGEGGHGPGLHGGDYLGPCLTGTAAANMAATMAATMAAQACGPWVLYQSDRTGNPNIFRLDIDSGATVNNINVSKGKGTGVQDMSPAHSPDGTLLAFSSNRDGHGEIYVGTADGSSQLRLTNSKGDNGSPMWSPDGKSIAYESTRNGNLDVFVADATSHQETQLTDDKADDGNPFWSPDSTKLLFQSHRDGLWQIYELTVSGKTLKRLSDGKSNDVNPQYSPDGKQIVFRSYPKAGVGNAVITTANADGSARLAISDSKGVAANPAWSPDNAMIAYQSTLTGSDEIYVYQLSSKATRQATDSSTKNTAPTWDCNNQNLVYTSVVNGQPQIFQTAALPIDAKPVKPADAQQLTGDSATNQNPENSPAVEDASHRVLEGNPQ